MGDVLNLKSIEAARTISRVLDQVGDQFVVIGMGPEDDEGAQPLIMMASKVENDEMVLAVLEAACAFMRQKLGEPSLEFELH